MNTSSTLLVDITHITRKKKAIGPMIYISLIIGKMLSHKGKDWFPHVLHVNELLNYQAGKYTEMFDKKEDLHLLSSLNLIFLGWNGL